MMKTGGNIHFNKTTSYVKAPVNDLSKIASVFHISTEQMLKKILPVRYTYMYVNIVCNSIG